MNKSIFPVIAILMLLSIGCTSQRFKTMESGMEYKIIKGDGKGDIHYGNFIKFRVTQYYNDSLMASPFDTVAQVIQLDSGRIPGEYIRIFMEAKAGDSIVTKISTDTVAKHNPLPPYAKEHQYFGTRFRILEVYVNEADAQKAQQEVMNNMRHTDSLAMEKQKGLDEVTIKNYLTDKKINAVRTPEGTYVEIIKQGEGDQVDTGKAVSVLYKGMLLDGSVFDQSYDSSGKPKEPFTFVVGRPGAIEGWSDGMVYFKEGGVGRLFIPSARAYGSRGAGNDIKPNTPIMFEINVTKVLSKDEYQKVMDQKKKEQEQQMEQMKQLQQMQQQQQNPQK